MRLPTLLVSLALPAALLVTGCGDDADAAQGGSGVEVVAAFYPFAFVVGEVGGDRVAVTNLTAPGAEPHDLELTPRQVAEVSEADLVVYLEGFQPAADAAIEDEAGDHALEVTSVSPLEDTGFVEEHEGEQKEGEEHEHELAGDPHLWLDPTQLVPIAEAVRDRLADVDPDGADAYASNTADLVERLEGLDQQMSTILATCEQRTFVTSHAAFGYLALAYDLEQIAISGLSPESEPSPARVAEVADIAERTGVTTIFYETIASPDTSRTVADELGLRTDVLDPVEGVEDPEADDYFSVMERNLAALVTANSCS